MNSYKKLCTEFYDIDKPSAPSDALVFYLRYAQKAKGPILEPMCGSGRFLLPLLEHGFSIDGVDASSDMLQACREKSQQRGLTTKLYMQYLNQLDLPWRYDLVIIPASSFSLITDPLQVQESLRCLHAHMAPGASFVLEIRQLMPQPLQDEPWGGRWVERPDGTKVVFSYLNHYNPTERVSHSLHRYELIRDGRLLETEWEELNIRYYKAGEFSALLEAAGFTAIQIFKAYGNTAPDDTNEDIIFECAKP